MVNKVNVPESGNESSSAPSNPSDTSRTLAQALSQPILRNGNVVLSDGSELFLPLYRVFTMSLEGLAENDPIAFYELVMKARDPKHTLFWNSSEKLEKLALLKDGLVQRDLAKFLTLAVEGDDLDMTLNTRKALMQGPQAAQTPEEKTTIEFSEKENFAAAQKIAQFVFEAVKNHPDMQWVESRLTQDPNAYSSQTQQGFFLEFSYGNPSVLRTPRGKLTIRWSLSSSGGLQRDELLASLGAEVYRPRSYSEVGEHGPVYKLTQFEGQPLPTAIEKDRKEYTPYKEANASWSKLKNAASE